MYSLMIGNLALIIVIANRMRFKMLGSRVGNLSYDSVGYLSLCLDAR